MFKKGVFPRSTREKLSQGLKGATEISGGYRGNPYVTLSKNIQKMQKKGTFLM